MLSVVGVTVFLEFIVFLAIIRGAIGKIRRATAYVERQVDDRTIDLDNSNAALRESETRFRDLAESASDGLWEMDANLKYTRVWGAIMEGFRDEGREPVGKTRWEYIGVDPSKEEHWRKHKEDLEARRQFRDFEYSYANSGGRQHRRASGKPIYDADGSFSGYRGIVENTTASVEARQEARRVHLLLEHAIQEMPMGIALYDAEDRLVLRNNIARDFGAAAQSVKVGAKFEEIVRASVAAHIIPEAAGREEEFILARLERHRNPAGPFEQIRANRRLEVREHRLPDGGTIVIQIDTTEKYAAEEGLRASQETLRLFMDSTNDLFLILDGDLDFVDANTAVAEAYGTTKEELVGRNLSVIAPQAKMSGRYDEFLEVIRTGNPHCFEIEEVSTIDGRTKFLSATAFKVGDGLGIVAKEITEKKMAEISIRESEQRFSSAFHRSPSMMDLSDMSSARIIDVNEAWLNTFGFEREDVIGCTSLELGIWVDPNERKALFEVLNRVGSVRDFNVRWRSSGGREITASVCVETLEQQGEPVMLSVCSDVTLQAEAERALREAKESAEISSRAKSEFLANMSHELRTPLNAIIGFSEMMCAEMFGSLGDPKYSIYANDIRSSGQHLLALVSDILDLSKIESGRDELEIVSIDLPGLLNDLRPLLAGQAEDRNIALDMEVLGELAGLMADRRKLKQILVNLLSNGIKFTEPGGVVCLSVFGGDDGGTTFRITDTGIGIANADIPIAMSHFGQIGDPLVKSHEGTGIGLPLTKALVEQHGGKMTLESEVGVGSTVTVDFPPPYSETRRCACGFGRQDRGQLSIADAYENVELLDFCEPRRPAREWMTLGSPRHRRRISGIVPFGWVWP